MEECHEPGQRKPSLHAGRMKVFEFPLLVVTDLRLWVTNWLQSVRMFCIACEFFFFFKFWITVVSGKI